MKPPTNQEITWSIVELNELLEDEDSHVHVVRTTKHLALHPYHLSNIQQGLNQILKSLLHTYDKELKGFVLTFKNPKLINNLGEVLYDSPFIHIDVDAEFYLFRPSMGCCVKGIVNKKGLDHIVILVHKIYTIAIPKPDDGEEWLGDLVEIGQEIKCCINHIDYMSKPPFICATLKSDYTQGCRLNIADDAVGMSNGIENHSDSESTSQLEYAQKRKINIVEDRGTVNDVSVKAERATTSVRIKSEKRSTPTEDEASSDRDGNRKKRKKKRHRSDEDKTAGLIDESVSVVKSERDEALSDRERKKRKKCHNSDENALNDESVSIVKSECDDVLSDRERKKLKKRSHKSDEDALKGESESIVKSERDEAALSDRERNHERRKRKRSRKSDEEVCKNDNEDVKIERDETVLSDRERNHERRKRKRSQRSDVSDVTFEDEKNVNIVNSEQRASSKKSDSPSKCERDRKPSVVANNDDESKSAIADHSWIDSVKIKQEKFSELEDNVPSDREKQRKKRKRTKPDDDVVA